MDGWVDGRIDRYNRLISKNKNIKNWVKASELASFIGICRSIMSVIVIPYFWSIKSIRVYYTRTLWFTTLLHGDELRGDARKRRDICSSRSNDDEWWWWWWWWWCRRYWVQKTDRIWLLIWYMLLMMMISIIMIV